MKFGGRGLVFFPFSLFFLFLFSFLFFFFFLFFFSSLTHHHFRIYLEKEHFWLISIALEHGVGVFTELLPSFVPTGLTVVARNEQGDMEEEEEYEDVKCDVLFVFFLFSFGVSRFFSLFLCFIFRRLVFFSGRERWKSSGSKRMSTPAVDL